MFRERGGLRLSDDPVSVVAAEPYCTFEGCELRETGRGRNDPVFPGEVFIIGDRGFHWVSFGQGGGAGRPGPGEDQCSTPTL